MKGQILDFNVQSSSGAISGDDGNRYEFAASAWKQSNIPERGVKVDFKIDGDRAVDVYVAIGSSGGVVRSGKSKVAAGVLALLLGGLGVHKFYLGRTGAGVIHLLCGTIGWLIIAPPIIMSLVSLIEGIIYLTKSDEDFQRIYIEEKRAWF